MTVLLAHTRAVGSYPSYLNITQDEADVVVTVREAPIVREGATEAGRTVTVRVPASIFAGMSKVQL